MAFDRNILRMMDFGQSSSMQSNSETHPLVAASMAMTDNKKARARTGNLVGLLLTHAARSRRRAQPRSTVRLQVLSPQGANAVCVRI